MANVIYDKKHDFGTLSTPATGTFPNILNLGETDAERMTVDFHCSGLAGGTSLTFAVQGSATEGGTYAAIVTGAAITLADLNAGVYQLPIPTTKFKFLKVALTAAGTFTGGTVQALLNTYVGK
ncbi:MAG: hypothetical protein LBU28_07010 [Spirochaetaceae bacterium]|jgi:hypothetical protein|nr:hypothetical protein [Spirochaetaceae bacterium]